MKPHGHDALDHSILLIKNSNKPYIIDSWLGFADYVPNVLKSYNGVYNKHFELDNIDISNSSFINIDEKFKNATVDKLTDSDYEELRKCLPELYLG